jgi:hypothetical protein
MMVKYKPKARNVNVKGIEALQRKYLAKACDLPDVDKTALSAQRSAVTSGKTMHLVAVHSTWVKSYILEGAISWICDYCTA